MHPTRRIWFSWKLPQDWRSTNQGQISI